MSDAKITLTTEAKNDGLEKLNEALAEGQQSVASMQKELNDLTKATKAGTQATKEQADEMVRLRKEINQQKAANKEYASEIGKTTAEIKAGVKAMADGDKGARGLAGAFKMTEGFTTAFSVAIGNMAANLAGVAVSAMADFAGQVVSLGAQMQQSVAHLAAMTGGTVAATEAYRVLNDTYRNTTFDEAAVFNMGEQLMRMGYSAQNAAGLIQLCADAAAGLGTGQQGAQQLVDAISRIQAVGELTSKQMVGLKMAGVDMDAAFKSLGMTGEQAMKAVEDGALDSQKAIAALTDYLHQYDGKMAESKDTTLDAWADVTGNLQTMCAEIGNSIFDAFNQSEVIQVLIDFTQSLIDMVRGDGCGAFSDLRAVADEVLNFIAGLLRFVFDTIKLVIIVINDAYAAFKSFGAQVVDAIRPAVDMVVALYNAVKAVMSSVGKNFGGEVARSWRKTFGTDPDDADSYAMVSANHFIRPSSAGGNRSGGGSGGSGGSTGASKTSRAEAEAKRKAEAEAKAAAKAYADEFNSVFSAMQSDSKSILDIMLGDKDEATQKIDEIKEKLIADMEAIDQAAAMSINQGDLTPLAAILKMTPEELTNQLTAKGEALSDFINRYKSDLAKGAAAQIESVQAGRTWRDTMQDYAVSVAGSISDAMTDIITGAKSGSEALADMAKSIIKNAVQILTKWLAVYAIFSAFPKAATSGYNATDMANMVVFGARRSITAAAGGGLITGPGTGISDSIPAMLSNGEYVIRSEAVDRLGVGFLNRLNYGARHFAEGGYVGSDPSAPLVPPVTINISNESGVAMTAEQTGSDFDGESYIVNVVMSAVATNRAGIRSVLKGAAT